MDYNDFSWERHNASRQSAELTSADREAISRLLIELRDLTLSRGTYIAATDFLKRFGSEADSVNLVQPEHFSR